MDPAPQTTATGDGATSGTGPADTATDTSGSQSGTPAPSPDTGSAPADGDVASLPSWAQKLISDTRAEAGKDRTNAKAQAAEQARQDLAQQIGKALGLVKDDKPADPAELTKKLTAVQDAHRTTAVELAVYKGAGRHGADPDALTDSRQFLAALDKLDPTASDFADQVSTAIKKAVEKNPKLKAQGLAPARSSGEFTGGTGDQPTGGGTSVDDFRKARRERRGI